jgi:polyferredoxin
VSRDRRPDLDTVYTINPDGSRNFLHPADVRGRWQVRKNLVWAVLLVIYLGLPFATVGGWPAVLFDIPGRSAHLFGTAFTNQDFYLVFFVFIGFGLTLFIVTSLWGRVWCGFACPQTVFMEGVFRRLERWIEGPRLERVRRNLGPWTADKTWRTGLKHVTFLVLCWFFAHAFIAYFLPWR